MGQADLSSPATAFVPEPETARPCAWATWRATLLLLGGWLVWRVVTLRWFCPYELVGDEANYWECARRLALSYHYSGPGVAAVVAAAAAVFGPVEWGLRLPAALAMGLTGLLVARLGITLGQGDERVGFFAALLFLLLPLTFIYSQFITYDPLYLPCWLGATWLFRTALQRHRAGLAAPGWWAAFGLVMGAGFLLKYSIIILVPALVVYLLLQRRTLAWDGRLAMGMAVALVTFLLAVSPVIIWNQQQGWPTLTYLRGHLNHPTDVPRKPYTPLWILEFPAAQVGFLGPGACALVILAHRAAHRRRHDSPAQWTDELLLWCSGASLVLFFWLTTLTARAQGNWALAAYPPLMALLGLHLVRELPRWPTATRQAWRWTVGFALGTLIALTAPGVVAGWPVIGRWVPLGRFQGARDRAAVVDRARHDLRRVLAREPLVIGKTYLLASQLAFYLPDRPTVYCAASYLGWRRNTYDFWPDTDLTAPALLGRPAILVGGETERWQQALDLQEMRPITTGRVPIFTARRYGGVRPQVRPRDGRRVR